MKRMIALTLTVLMLAALLAGCGSTQPEAPQTPAPVSETAKPTEAPKATETPAAETPAETEAPAPEQPITVTDAVGRQVELPSYATRVAVLNRYNLELIRACGLIDKVIAVDDSIIENHIYWPEFSPEDSFGGSNEVNVEALAEFEPEALITAFYSEDLEKSLAPFGIPVIALIGYDVNMNNSIDIIEQVFGQTEGSAALRAFFNEVNGTITDIAATIPEAERKTAVWESIKDYSAVKANNDWGKMIERAGGINVFADVAFENSDIDGEAYLVADPDFIFKMVAASGADLSGYTPPSEEDYLAATDAYLARPGFGEITAVQNGDVRFVTSFAMGGMGKLVGTAYIAKWMYPEQYASLDPDAIFARWLEEFQNIAFVDGQSWRIGDHQA